MMLATWGSSATSDDAYFSILYVIADGALLSGIPGGPRRSAGRIAVAGRTIAGLWIDPKGTQMLSRWEGSERTQRVGDLWISNVPGDCPERFTASGDADVANWSPDCTLIACRTRARLEFRGSDCIGANTSCELQYTGTTSRNVIDDKVATPWFKVTAAGGRSAYLGCDLTGWTR